MEQLKTGAIYIRVSTDKQDELSPDSQKKLLIDYAKNNNIVIDENYIFDEIGISGKKAEKRPKFQRMISLAKSKSHPFDVILVWKYSRFARNQEESIVYKSLLKKNNVEVISVSEPLVEGPFGSLIERIIEWMDEYYSIRLSGEVLRGMTENAMRGKNQTKAVYGYNIDPGHTPTINKNESEIISMIFDLYVNKNKSFYYIAKYINDIGYKTKKAMPFASRSIEYIITNPFYCGYIRWNVRDRENSTIRDKCEWIEQKGNHSPIISEELFKKATERYANEHSKTNRSRPTQTYTHYLSGLMYCSSCGSKLMRSKGKGNNNKIYANFQCDHYTKGQCNVSHAISQFKAERAILDSLYEFVSNDNSKFEKIVPKTVKTDTALLEGQLSKINAKEERIKAAFINGIDTIDEYKKNKEVISSEKNKILSELSEINKYNDLITKEDKDALDVKIRNAIETLESNNYTMEEKSNALRTVVSKIIYDKKAGIFEVFYYSS